MLLFSRHGLLRICVGAGRGGGGGGDGDGCLSVPLAFGFFGLSHFGLAEVFEPWAAKVDGAESVAGESGHVSFNMSSLKQR